MGLKADWPNTQQTLGEAALRRLRVLLVVRTGEESGERVTNGQELRVTQHGELKYSEHCAFSYQM